MPDAVPDAVLHAPDRSRAAGAALLTGFAAALCASAFLVFSVQPMVSRMVLPRLGGSPAVWNTCVCFLQAALLLGYAYAHLATGRLRPRAQVALHGAVPAAALALLPVSLGTGAPAADASPVGWLLGQLALGVGLPFVAIAGTEGRPLDRRAFRHPRRRPLEVRPGGPARRAAAAVVLAGGGLVYFGGGKWGKCA